MPETSAPVPSSQPSRWFFNRSLDLDKWLPAISTDSGEGQDNEGDVIAAFDESFAPTERHARMLAASQEMYLLLKPALPTLQLLAAQTHDSALLEQCTRMAERLAEIDAAPDTGSVR